MEIPLKPKHDNKLKNNFSFLKIKFMILQILY